MELKFLRKLDALIAEKVMGWSKYPAHDGRKELWAYPGMNPAANTWDVEVPCYSTEISAAWDVVEKSKLLRDYLLYQHDEGWIVQDHSERMFCEGDTAPHAICLAALKAVGYSGHEKEK